MNPVVLAQLSAFSKANEATDGLKEYECFEAYSIYSIFNGLLTNNLDPFAVHLKGDEFGIDGLGILIDGELCIDADDVAAALQIGKNHDVEFILLQAKRSDNLDFGEMSKFFEAAISFFNGSFHNPTDQLQELIAAKDSVYSAALKQNPILRLFFVSTGLGEAKGVLEQLVNTSKTRLEELNIFSQIQIDVIGAKKLQDGYRSATSSITGTIEIPNTVTLPPHPSVKEAYLGYVSGAQLMRLVTEKPVDGGQVWLNRGVFFDNVRDYDENSEINKGIIEQLKAGDQKSFIFKNNGITVVAKDIRRTGNTFTLDDFQVINGCQTTNILFTCREYLENVVVPFRLIGADDPEFVSSIIIGTNKQNEVREDQFWSLLPFMKSLEEYCREQPAELKIYVERRENQYRESAIERKRISKPRDLLKAVAAMLLFRPHRAARDYRGVAKEFSRNIFQSKHTVVPYHAAAFAAFRIDSLIRTGRIERNKGIYKYFVLSALGFSKSGGKDVFSLKTTEQEKIGTELIDFLKSDDQLTVYFLEIAKKLDDWNAEEKRTDREKIRDAIRTEQFYQKFKGEFMRDGK
jgi:AIPR protein